MFEGVISAAAGLTMLFSAFSSSGGYQLQTYGLGSGGTNNASSPTYRLNGSTGEVGGDTNSPNNGGNTGSTETRQANVPLAPTLSNGSSTYYNKLQVTINKGGSDPTDYTYSIAVSTNNFATTNYIQADGTIGGTAIYQSYATWGGASGSFITGLSPNTAYQVKANAMQGAFTGSAYGPSATSTTANPALSFSITPNIINLGSLLPGTVVTSGANITFGFATNAATGGSVYVSGSNGGLKSVTANNTIGSISANLTSQNEGFGVQGSTAGQTSGGPFTITSPFNGTSNTVGAPTTTFQQLFTTGAALAGGNSTASVKGKASSTTPSASDYSETLTFIASASY